jgi:hypothetical protein
MAINYKTTIVTTTPYTATSSDEVILVDVTSGPKTIMLPTSSGSSPGRALYIKDYSGTSLTNPITIKGSPGKLIDGVSFAMLNGGYSHIQVVYDGANWMTIS